MTTSIPINRDDAPAPPACIIDPEDGPWDILIAAREAGENFVDQHVFDRSRAYDAHDRIVVGLGGAGDHHPATVSPDALQRWIVATARDDRDAMVLRTALEILLAYVVRLGLREGEPAPSIPGSRPKPRPYDRQALSGSSRPTPISAGEAMALTETIFGPRNGWSVLAQGLVTGAWYQGLSCETQAAFILRCKNIAVAFDADQALWPSATQPEDMRAWIAQQTKNDTVAAGYHVAFNRLLRAIDANDWRLAALSPPHTALWASCSRRAHDEGETDQP